ncbi:LytR C-terminal domain-containing protein [Nocardia sp. GCM10030253]|uniref:LytR C-terminal domain-containing protein n=1 Tax=Nocardia sp. GCM10030253 TaxID=3273404 RepID=UPI0036390E43
MSYPNPTSGGPPLRALAMVLIALAIVFAGLGAMSLSNSDTDTSGAGESEAATPASQVQATSAVVRTTAAAPTSVAATTTTATSTTTTPPATTAALNRAVPVRVLNNSLVVGLASRTASQLSASGWNVAEVGNYPGENVAKTTVFYGNTPGEREAAAAIAAELGASAVPRSTGTGDSGSGVTVVVTGN